MKNLTIFISLFLILISIAGYTQDFGDPLERQITTQQTYYRTQSFVVIPLYHMSPALIAFIMGGEIIYDEPGANSFGGRQNSDYNQNQNYGNSNQRNSRGHLRENYNY